jgi:hypothetical protein
MTYINSSNYRDCLDGVDYLDGVDRVDYMDGMDYMDGVDRIDDSRIRVITGIGRP